MVGHTRDAAQSARESGRAPEEALAEVLQGLESTGFRKVFKGDVSVFLHSRVVN